MWAEEEARACGMPTDIKPPDVKRYGFLVAVFVRNGEIAKACDSMTAFWDRMSTGTADAVERTLKLGKPVLVYGPNGETVDPTECVELLRRTRKERRANAH